MKNNKTSFSKVAAANVSLILAIGALSIPATNFVLEAMAKSDLAES